MILRLCRTARNAGTPRALPLTCFSPFTFPRVVQVFAVLQRCFLKVQMETLVLVLLASAGWN